MLIVPSSALSPPRRGDLGATVEAETLKLPAEVIRSLAASQVRTAEELLSLLQAFPGALAGALGWELEDIQAAKQRLRETLRGHLRPEFFRDEPPLKRRYGVLPRSR